MFRAGKLDDNIVLVRFLAGVIYGFIAYIIYRVNFYIIADAASTIWLLASFLYVCTIYYVYIKFNVQSLFKLLIRGLLTFYGSWILVFLVLYDLLG